MILANAAVTSVNFQQN